MLALFAIGAVTLLGGAAVALRRSSPGPTVEVASPSSVGAAPAYAPMTAPPRPPAVSGDVLPDDLVKGAAGAAVGAMAGLGINDVLGGGDVAGVTAGVGGAAVGAGVAVAGVAAWPIAAVALPVYGVVAGIEDMFRVAHGQDDLEAKVKELLAKQGRRGDPAFEAALAEVLRKNAAIYVAYMREPWQANTGWINLTEGEDSAFDFHLKLKAERGDNLLGRAVDGNGRLRVDLSSRTWVFDFRQGVEPISFKDHMVTSEPLTAEELERRRELAAQLAGSVDPIDLERIDRAPVAPAPDSVTVSDSGVSVARPISSTRTTR